jgi:hypothetical protein
MAVIACTAAIGDESWTIERIVAVVDAQPVFLSEVRSWARLRKVDRKVALEALIDEMLMYREALRFPPAHATPEEEEAALASLMKSDMLVPDLDESDLRRTARRQATILKYIAMRLEPQIRIDPEMIRRRWEEEYVRSAVAPTFESVSERIERRLREQAMDRRIEAWVRALRQEAQIRYNDASVEDNQR